MKKKNPKPKKPLDPEDNEDDEPELHTQSQISVGDVTIVSRKGLAACKKELKGLLQDKTIQKYLNVYQTKKLIGSPLSYIG